MRVNLQWNNVELIRRLEKGERRLAFAAVNTINGTAKDIQEAQKEAVKAKLTVRVASFTLKQVAVIKPFASVGQSRAFAEVAIGQRPRSLLSTLERGGIKPHRGKNVAIAVTGGEARPSFAQPQAFPPLIRRLRFKKPRRSRKAGKPGGKVVLQGEGGRFLIPGKGIYRREGGSVRAIYVYKPTVRIRPKLGWLDRARRIGTRSMKERMEREAINAIGRG